MTSIPTAFNFHIETDKTISLVRDDQKEKNATYRLWEVLIIDGDVAQVVHPECCDALVGPVVHGPALHIPRQLVHRRAPLHLGLVKVRI